MLRKICYTAKTEYILWITNPRIILLFSALIFLYEFIIRRFSEKIVMMDNQYINALEPYIAVINSPFTILIMPVCFLLLMADFPKIHGNTLISLYRTGRYAWLIGQLVFFFLCALTFIAVVFIVSFLPLLNRSFFANGWSMVTLDFNRRYPEYISTDYAMLPPISVYNHTLPYQCALWSTLTFAGYYFIMGLVMIIFKLVGHHSFGILTAASIIGLGYSAFYSNSIAKWIFPMSNSLLSQHYANYLRKAEFPLLYSAVYFPLIIILLLSIALRVIKKSNIFTGDSI